MIFIHTTSESRVRLDSRATLEAVKNENSCNPIVRSVTHSYLTVAQRYYLLLRDVAFIKPIDV